MPIGLSIVIPSYNMEKWLPVTIESCLDQSDPDLEVIVVNDGSQDRTPHIADTYAKLDSRVRVIHQENKGLGATRQVGQDAARGQYVTWLDADDFLAPNGVRDMVNVARRDNVRMVCGNAVVFSDTTFNTRSYFHKPEIAKTTFANPDYWKSKVVWRWIFDVEFLRESVIDHPRFKLGQDAVFMFSALGSVGEFSQCPSHFYFFRQDHKSPPKALEVEVEHQLMHFTEAKKVCMQKGLIKPLIKYLQENYYRDLGKLLPRTENAEDPWAKRILEISLDVFDGLDPKWFTAEFLAPELKPVPARIPLAEALIAGDEATVLDLFDQWRQVAKKKTAVNKKSAFHTYRRRIKSWIMPLSFRARSRLHTLESRAAKRLGAEWWK